MYVTMLHLNQAIFGAKEPKEIFDRVCETAVGSGLYKFAWIGIADEPNGEMRSIAKAGMPDEFDPKSLLSALASPGRSETSLQAGQTIVSNRALEVIQSPEGRDFLQGVGAKSIASIPICKDGKPFAALMLGSGRANAFGKEETSLLEGMAAGISLSIDRYESERRRMVAEFDLKGLTSEFEKKIKQAESATIRAQTYLDFMSHDLTNILTPIMTYAEMIFSDERVPIENRKYGRVVIDHVLRAAKFITRVKNLAIAETMPMDKKEVADFRESILLAQSEVFKRYPSKDIEIEYGYPDDEPILVHGGNLIESVVEEILDNAIKYSIGPRVEIKVLVSQIRAEEDRPFWKIEITDDGPGIYPQLRDALMADASGEDNRLSRVIATGIPFMTLIVKHLGGKLAIEDRVPGTHSRGTRIIMTIPVYSP